MKQRKGPATTPARKSTRNSAPALTLDERFTLQLILQEAQNAIKWPELPAIARKLGIRLTTEY